MATMLAVLPAAGTAAGLASAAVIEGPALIGTARRVGRVLHAVLTVTRRHAPRWMAVVITAALFIPGPIDEIVIGPVCVAWLLWRRPAMRPDMVASVRAVWAGQPMPPAPAAQAAAETASAVNVTLTRRVRFGTVAAKLAAAVMAAGLIVVPAIVTAPVASAANSAASVIVAHARHRQGATRPVHPVGCVDDTGRLVAVWPCHYQREADGTIGVYAP